MKKTIALLCSLALTLVLAVGCNQQQETIKIGIVDEAAAFKDNKLAKDAMAYLQEVGAPLQAEAEAAYKAMQDNQNEETVAAYKLAMGKLQSLMNEEQQRIVALVDAKFNETLEKYRAEKGLTLIMSKQAVISVSESIDITNDIVTAMDAITMDFAKVDEAPASEAAAGETKAEEAKSAE